MRESPKGPGSSKKKRTSSNVKAELVVAGNAGNSMPMQTPTKPEPESPATNGEAASPRCVSSDVACSPELKIETATSTTSGVEDEVAVHGASANVKSPSNDPADWSVDEVMNYLISVDPALNIHAELFRKHVSLIPLHESFKITKFSVVGN